MKENEKKNAVRAEDASPKEKESRKLSDDDLDQAVGGVKADRGMTLVRR